MKRVMDSTQSNRIISCKISTPEIYDFSITLRNNSLTLPAAKNLSTKNCRNLTIYVASTCYRTEIEIDSQNVNALDYKLQDNKQSTST